MFVSLLQLFDFIMWFSYDFFYDFQRFCLILTLPSLGKLLIFQKLGQIFTCVFLQKFHNITWLNLKLKRGPSCPSKKFHRWFSLVGGAWHPLPSHLGFKMFKFKLKSKILLYQENWWNETKWPRSAWGHDTTMDSSFGDRPDSQFLFINVFTQGSAKYLRRNLLILTF